MSAAAHGATLLTLDRRAVPTDRPCGARHRLLAYGHVLDELIFETITTRLGDFGDFEREVLQALAQS